MKIYNVVAPSRANLAPGVSPGAGGASLTPGRVGRPFYPSAVGGPTDLGSQISSTWSGFLGGAVNAAEVALGAVLIVAAIGIVVSQTSAGRAAGGAAGGAARRGARLIPGVGALA